GMGIVASYFGDLARPATAARKRHSLRGSMLSRLALLGSVSVIVLASLDHGSAGQLPTTAFQTYDAGVASSIVAGPFALY
ncbi:hypothetical protein, partial [Citrobacter freundii]|uniref:hypothetical protein n=1 Tax=Citrobacter freundii TaxID=546 RepID=UPI0013D747F5